MKVPSWLRISPSHSESGPHSGLGRLIRRTISPLFSSLSILLLTLPSPAAERISFTYGLFERLIPIASLETFAREGRIDEETGSLSGEFKF